MNARASLWASMAIAASIGLAGCGGSSDKNEGDGSGGVTPKSVTLPSNIPAGMELTGNETIELAAGRTATRNGVTFTCTGEPCTIKIEDGKAEYTGGTVEAALSQAAKDRNADKQIADQKRDDDSDAKLTTARKLYSGIGNAPLTATGEGFRRADYNSAETEITVMYDGPDTANTDAEVSGGVELKEDKTAPINDNHGWEGKKYTASGTDVRGTYEAVVYSDIGDSEEGKKFGQVGVDDSANDGYLYLLNDDGEAPQSQLNKSELIESSRFDHTAGSKEFKLPTNNVRVMIPGSYHGVSGAYFCTPADASTCAVQKAAKGFTLGGTADADNAFTDDGGVWVFKPTNPENRVTSKADDAYASYGWWIHKAEDGTYTASAFVDFKGTPVPNAIDFSVASLNGTATYTGGAAGKYALSSSTGGTNDAGDFTAKVMLSADFNEDEIKGTIDTFVGGDGESRNWSVELMESDIANNGGIGSATTKTVWTIGGKAAAAAGQWSGSLQDRGDDGVPKFATGRFHSAYDTGGNMVGAFGVNVD